MKYGKLRKLIRQKEDELENLTENITEDSDQEPIFSLMEEIQKLRNKLTNKMYRIALYTLVSEDDPDVVFTAIRTSEEDEEDQIRVCFLFTDPYLAKDAVLYFRKDGFNGLAIREVCDAMLVQWNVNSIYPVVNDPEKGVRLTMLDLANLLRVPKPSVKPELIQEGKRKIYRLAGEYSYDENENMDLDYFRTHRADEGTEWLVAIAAMNLFYRFGAAFPFADEDELTDLVSLTREFFAEENGDQDLIPLPALCLCAVRFLRIITEEFGVCRPYDFMSFDCPAWIWKKKKRYFKISFGMPDENLFQIFEDEMHETVGEEMDIDAIACIDVLNDEGYLSPCIGNSFAA